MPTKNTIDSIALGWKIETSNLELLKNKDIGEDEEKKFEKIVQTFTDDHIKTIDTKVELKEKEIMTI